MLLSFDALGRHGLVQFPPLQNALLIASGGSLTQTARAVTFAFAQLSAFGELALAGVLVGLQAKQSAGFGVFHVAGITVTFEGAASADPASVSFGGAGSTLRISQSLAAGSHSIAEGSSSFGTFEPATTANYVAAASDVAFVRDFEAWFPRAFDLDDWTLQAIESGDWTTEPAASPGWNLSAPLSASWTVATDNQSETWNEK